MSQYLSEVQAGRSLGALAMFRRVAAYSRQYLPEILSILLMGAYIFYFCSDLSERWFHPQWATDDSLQQSFPFHAVEDDTIFSGDIIHEMMVRYLAPLHYALGYGVTVFTGDPVMTGHWLMLLQILLCMIPLFLLLRGWAGVVPATAGVVWLFHSRHIMQRITAGLQRGWAPGVILLFLYCVMKRSHRATLLAIFFACVLHPPSGMIIAGTYWLVLVFRYCQSDQREWAKKGIILYLLMHPIFIASAFYAVHKPAHLGKMVTYEEAEKLPEFSRENGRFKFVPLREPWDELKTYGFQAFTSIFYSPGFGVKKVVPIGAVILTALLLLVQLIRRREYVPVEIWAYLATLLISYWLSRLLAFQLFVPNRYIQIPLALFFIVAFPIALWRLVESKREEGVRTLTQCGAIAALMGVIFWLGGTGIYGDANFNMPSFKRGHLWTWIEKNTPSDSLIAGHPTLLNPVQLFGKRKGYVTTETAHPFYGEYFKEMKRRLRISFRAHYAADLREVVDLLEPEGVDYFVFWKREFYPKALESAEYFDPIEPLVKKLTSRHYTDYAYKQLPKEIDAESAPYMPFRDHQSVVVDIQQLRAYLNRTDKQSEESKVG